jgi:hypothetical protein
VSSIAFKHGMKRWSKFLIKNKKCMVLKLFFLNQSSGFLCFLFFWFIFSGFLVFWFFMEFFKNDFGFLGKRSIHFLLESY